MKKNKNLILFILKFLINKEYEIKVNLLIKITLNNFSV